MSEQPPAPVPVTVAFTSDTMHGHGSPNTRLLLNGQDITKYVRAFALRADVHETITATIEIFPRDGFTLELPAAVVITAIVYPGCDLIEVTNGSETRWRAERRPEP